MTSLQVLLYDSNYDDMTGTRVIGSNFMVQPIQLSRVHRPYRVTKARAYRTKRRLLLLLTNVASAMRPELYLWIPDINQLYHVHSGSTRFIDLIPRALDISYRCRACHAMPLVIIITCMISII